MLLSQLFPDTTLIGADVAITGLSCDSRTVQKGFLFAAFAGDKADGRTYINQAIKNGAAALLVSRAEDAPQGITAIVQPEPRLALAKMAAQFYPHQPKTIAAVTGTSGKTSTVTFTRQLWQLCGHRAASIGTLGVIGNDIERYGSLTTPDSVSLQKDLQMLADEKRISHVAMEASSHGLDQYRLDGVQVRLAAFTNLSRDHLDYHKTMEAYFTAKKRLFTALLPAGGTAILNADCAEFDALKEAVGADKTVFSFGEKPSDLQLLEKHYRASGQDLSLKYKGKIFKTRINLVGAFQSANAMCAAALAICSGEDAEKIFALLPQLQPVRGRLECVGAVKGGAVYVDYAHKPDALEQVLKALRPHTSGKLVTVFGCGGDRDQGKRPIMGEIAARLSDSVIVTDDNPRSENPASIRAAILQGCPQAKDIGDRAQAIAYAINEMQAGDVVLIAGKGHEPGQIIGDKMLPFDDALVARNAMKDLAA